MFDHKPVIGLLGGIGSGKSFVAQIFAQLGCAVISSDDLARQAYDDPAVRQCLLDWWGPAVLRPDGSVDRRAIADRIFADSANPTDRRRLESLLHPIVEHRRQQLMHKLVGNTAVRAFVWDTPLLVESGLHRQCDALVFVDAPLPLRQNRVASRRGWGPQELARREKMQSPLDNKRAISQYTVVNAADAGFAREQVEDVLSRILVATPTAHDTTP
jgi:dephospho-CoA kinase